MTRHAFTRLAAALLGAGLAGTLAACGSSGGGAPATTPVSNPASSPRSSATSGTPSSPSSPSSRSSSGGTAVTAACEVTDQATVASVFAGAGKGTTGEARNCEYKVPASAVDTVNVYYYGSSSDWDTEKSQAAQFTGPLTKLAIGDDAFLGAHGGGAVTVKAGAIVFAVQVLPASGAPDNAFFAKQEAAVESLARKIAAQH